MKIRTNGFSLVELLISIGLAAIFIPGLVNVFSFSLGSASSGENYTKAYTIAQENMEIIYYLKEYDPNWTWTTSPENTNPDEYYQPVTSGNSKILGPKLSGTPPETDGYAVRVNVFPVIRDLNGNITEDNGNPGNDIDPGSRKIEVNVKWKEKGVPTDVNLVSYISEH